MNKADQEKLYFNLFQQAKRNVDSLITEADVSQEETDALINKEADRLLAVFVESRSGKKK